MAPGLEATRVRHRRRSPTAPTTTTTTTAQARELWDLVQTLPKKARAVVVLRYYEELSEAETADALGISVGTVKSQASRALATLRDRAPHTLNPREEER